jgi:hypothetical protein
MTEEEIQQQKDIEYYAASVNAWYTSALEHDKSIFALAGGGIALLITLLTTIGFEGWFTFSLFFVAIMSFFVALGCLLWVFRLNQDYIQKTLGAGSPVTDPKLKKLDQTARWAFGIGVLFASAVGFAASYTTFEKKRTERENTMANDKSKLTESTPTFNGSVNGAAVLKPDSTKSFHGSGTLRPAAPVTSTAPVAPTPASAPVAAVQPTAQPSSGSKSAP